MQDPTRTTSAEARLLGDSAAMNAVRRFIADAGAHSLPVMLLGESGSGKELVAQALALAAGAGRPWVALNCASLDDQLVLSELFGHERGAFTGACGLSPWCPRAGLGVAPCFSMRWPSCRAERRPCSCGRWRPARSGAWAVSGHCGSSFACSPRRTRT